MSFAWAARADGGLRWLIIRKPATSMPFSRAHPMCCSATSASVQWVATRTLVTPREWARLRSSTVPMPGIRSVVSLAFLTTEAAAEIHSSSVWEPCP